MAGVAFGMSATIGSVPTLNNWDAGTYAQLAGVLGGGLTPLFAQALAENVGLAAVGWYGSIAAGLSLVALIATRPRRRVHAVVLEP